MIKTSCIGQFENKDVLEAHMVSSSGVEVDIMNYGVTVRDWRVPIVGGTRSVVLGFEEFTPYPEHSPFFGAILGRVASRTSGAMFEIEGDIFNLDANDGPNHLHGGARGLSHQIWEMEADSKHNRVCYSHLSKDGAMGFPGEVKFEAIYTLTGNILELELCGVPDRPTPISLAQHHYFNLGRQEHVLDHMLQIKADQHTPYDKNLLPTGEILPVNASILDFRSSKNLRGVNGQALDFDANFVLNRNRDPQDVVARLISPDEELSLTMQTDRPGLQLYNSVTLDVDVPGTGGRVYKKYSGLCLEDQMFPDALHNSNFPAIICTPDKPYKHWCAIKIG